MLLSSVADLDMHSFRDADGALRYLKQRYIMARFTSYCTPPLGTIAGNIIALYEQIIVPCIRDSSPYALERPGDFNGPIRTLILADVVGEEAPITTIYDAIALVITLSETSVHTHPGDHNYYKRLVGLYTYVCVLIQARLSFGPTNLLPIAAIVVYGYVGPYAKRLPGFLGNHACSLSTSLPKVQGNSYAGLKTSALKTRRDFMYRMMPGYTRYLVDVCESIEQNLELAEDWVSGNCAETLPMTRRSTEGCDMLFGVCVYMNQPELAMQGHPKGPEVCIHCSLLMNCFNCPYVDMVHYTVCPRPVTPTKIKLVGVDSINPPTWNAEVARDAAWKHLLLRQVLPTLSSSPIYTLASFDTLSRLPPPSQLPVLLCLSAEQQRLWIQYWISQHIPRGASARDSEAGYVMSNDSRNIARDIAHPGTIRQPIFPPPHVPALKSPGKIPCFTRLVENLGTSDLDKLGACTQR